MGQIAVELVRKAPEDVLSIRVRIWSEKRRDLISVGYINADADQLPLRVARLADVLAERQCLLYKDDHNPLEYARVAEEATKKLMAKGAKMNQIIEEQSDFGAS